MDREARHSQAVIAPSHPLVLDDLIQALFVVEDSDSTSNRCVTDTPPNLSHSPTSLLGSGFGDNGVLQSMQRVRSGQINNSTDVEIEGEIVGRNFSQGGSWDSEGHVAEISGNWLFTESVDASKEGSGCLELANEDELQSANNFDDSNATVFARARHASRAQKGSGQAHQSGSGWLPEYPPFRNNATHGRSRTVSSPDFRRQQSNRHNRSAYSSGYLGGRSNEQDVFESSTARSREVGQPNHHTTQVQHDCNSPGDLDGKLQCATESLVETLEAAIAMLGGDFDDGRLDRTEEWMHRSLPVPKVEFTSEIARNSAEASIPPSGSAHRVRGVMQACHRKMGWSFPTPCSMPNTFDESAVYPMGVTEASGDMLEFPFEVRDQLVNADAPKSGNRQRHKGRLIDPLRPEELSWEMESEGPCRPESSASKVSRKGKAASVASASDWDVREAAIQIKRSQPIAVQSDSDDEAFEEFVRNQECKFTPLFQGKPWGSFEGWDRCESSKLLDSYGNYSSQLRHVEEEVPRFQDMAVQCDLPSEEECASSLCKLRRWRPKWPWNRKKAEDFQDTGSVESRPSSHHRVNQEESLIRGCGWGSMLRSAFGQRRWIASPEPPNDVSYVSEYDESSRASPTECTDIPN